MPLNYASPQGHPASGEPRRPIESIDVLTKRTIIDLWMLFVHNKKAGLRRVRPVIMVRLTPNGEIYRGENHEREGRTKAISPARPEQAPSVSSPVSAKVKSPKLKAVRTRSRSPRRAEPSTPDGEMVTPDEWWRQQHTHVPVNPSSVTGVRRTKTRKRQKSPRNRGSAESSSALDTAASATETLQQYALRWVEQNVGSRFSKDSGTVLPPEEVEALNSTDEAICGIAPTRTLSALVDSDPAAPGRLLRALELPSYNLGQSGIKLTLPSQPRTSRPSRTASRPKMCPRWLHPSIDHGVKIETHTTIASTFAFGERIRSLETAFEVRASARAATAGTVSGASQQFTF